MDRIFLVPKLCLGIHSGTLCVAEGIHNEDVGSEEIKKLKQQYNE
jgi:hypothetical protein